MKKRLFVSFLLVCAVFCSTSFAYKVVHATGNDYTLSTFTTPYGASVPIAYLQGADVNEEYNNLSNYPSAVRIGNGSKKYNCFTYALIFNGNINNLSQHASNEIFNVENASNLITGNPCLTRVNFNEVTAGDIVMYKILPTQTEFFPNTYNHAGIVYEKGSTLESTVILSKWGTYPVYRHNLTDNPYMGTSYQLCLTEQPIERVIGFSFFRVNHNYTYSIKYIATPSIALPQRSTYHKAVCSDCGSFHYEYHTYINVNNYMVCKDCGYNTNHMVNSVIPETN